MARRLPDFAAMAPGCRGPAARFAAERHLTALAILDDTPPNARRIGMHRTALARLARAGQRLGFDLQPAAAALATHPHREPTMTSTRPTYAMFDEDLTQQPAHAEIRDLLKTRVERGVPPADVLEAALANASALSLEVKGLVATSLSFYRAGAALAHACPEIQAVAAESLRLVNAVEDRVAEMGGQRRPGTPRTDH